MLSYQHAFHAGNHADVLKHFVLFNVLQYYLKKPKAFAYIDSHSGRGLYPIADKAMQKLKEFETGILRVLQQQPEHLAEFTTFIQKQVPAQSIAGSPFFAAKMLRKSDQIYLYERHKNEITELDNTLKRLKPKAYTTVLFADGFAGVVKQLPPQSRRAVVLIDPAYEVKTDYQQVVKTVQAGLKKHQQATICAWYPQLAAAAHTLMVKRLNQLAEKLNLDYLDARLSVRESGGMFGSGVWVVNPPYVLPDILNRALPDLLCMATDDKADYQLDVHIR